LLPGKPNSLQHLVVVGGGHGSGGGGGGDGGGGGSGNGGCSGCLLQGLLLFIVKIFLCGIFVMCGGIGKVTPPLTRDQ
jgi:hypothetical protein